ncbi:MAG: hypothetical protein VW600_00065 [Ferrovibrio sp.]
MNPSGKTDQARTSIVVLGHPAAQRMAGSPCFTALVAIDLAAEVAALDAGHVSEALAAGALSLTNLQPDALPKLLQQR